MEWVLAGALVMVSALLVWREVYHTNVERDLHNRLMARSLPEYQAMNAPKEADRKRHNVLVRQQERMQEERG